MVEGPGCKLKGEKIRARFLKQTVKGVRGNAVDREEKLLKRKKKKDSAAEGAEETPSADSSKFQGLVGRSLDEVLSLGKELFMFFGDSCLRCHFLMAGSFRVNGENVDKDGGKNTPATFSLEIQFSIDTLTFYKSGAEIRPSSACYQKHANLRDLDICSPTFSARRAAGEMMLDGERQLCDVLLDQEVLPGVGNIIKNEALFDTGLKPNSKIKELSEEHIFFLVKMTRDFSMLFYKCRKNGTNLRTFMKVYQKGKCGECGAKIVSTRMGEDNPRLTCFCPECQTSDGKKIDKLKVPSKNCLLGWVQSGKEATAKDEWPCSKCTFLNPAGQSNCSICLASRNPVSPSTEEPPLLQSKRKSSENHDQSPSAEKRQKVNGNEANSSKDSTLKSPPHNSMNDEQDSCEKFPPCSSHRTRCVMRQTFKENENKGRWFFVCALAQASKRCNFFKWADECFPHCSGHGKVCALRTVMKQGPNNGRRFFCCPLRKNSCQFFEWAVGYG